MIEREDKNLRPFHLKLVVSKKKKKDRGAYSNIDKMA